MAASTAPRAPHPTQSHQLGGTRNQRPNIFRPPLSPATSTSQVSYGTAAGGSSRQSSTRRKRSRGTSPTVTASTPNLRRQGDCYFSTPFNAPSASAAKPFEPVESPAARSVASPPPFVNTRYNLAGGLDTPAGSAAARYESENEWRDHEQNFRRQWGTTGEPSLCRSSPNGANGQTWGQFMFGIVSGSLDIAGKVIQFARKGAFKGFYAGGGQGYALDLNGHDEAVDAKMQQSVWEDADPSMHQPTPFEVVPIPLPGQYPDGDSPQGRAAKRKKGSDGGWVMVEQPSAHDGDAPPQDPFPSRAATPGLASRRHSLIPRPAASRSSSRRSLAAPTLVARRHSSTATHAGSPLTLNTERPASTASPRCSPSLIPSPSSKAAFRRGGGAPNSRPGTANGHRDARRNSSAVELSPDAQLYQARIMKQERLQDASMRKMNAKLQNMIREGKAALGTRVDVENEMDVEVGSSYFAKERW